MFINDPGNIICECGNDELVFVRALPPWEDYFVILCRKCKARGALQSRVRSLMSYPKRRREVSHDLP